MQDEKTTGSEWPATRTIRFRRDGEMIVCKQFAARKGFICVDGQPDYRLVLEWKEDE